MNFKKIKLEFIEKIPSIKLIDESYKLELINHKHTKCIVAWRNDPSNLELFENGEDLTEQIQSNFISNYNNYNRVDLVLNYKNKPIGVFNVKNLDSVPEYGSLIGEKEFRGKGLNNVIKKAIINFWFYELNHKVIYVKIKEKNQFLIDSNIKIGFKKIRMEGELIVLELKKEVE